MHRKRIRWVALVGIGLAGVVTMSGATALAARSAVSPFELVAIDRYEAECPDCFHSGRHVATFTSGAPFCDSGIVEDVASLPRNEINRRYTCSDGSGSLTVAEGNRGGGKWTIVDGSGRYAHLRGKGSYSYELVSEYPPADVYRTTLRGFADADAVAPSVAFTSAIPTKLRRPPGSYSIRVALSLRDDVEGNTVAYMLRVTEGPEHPRDRRLPELGRIEGSTAFSSVSKTFHVVPSSKRVRSVDLWLYGSDWIGNEQWVTRSLKLPR